MSGERGATAMQKQWGLKLLLALPAILITGCCMLYLFGSPSDSNTGETKSEFYTFAFGIALWNCAPLIALALGCFLIPGGFYYPMLASFFIFSLLLFWEIAHDSSSTAAIGFLFTPILILMLGVCRQALPLHFPIESTGISR